MARKFGKRCFICCSKRLKSRKIENTKCLILIFKAVFTRHIKAQDLKVVILSNAFKSKNYDMNIFIHFERKKKHLARTKRYPLRVNIDFLRARRTEKCQRDLIYYMIFSLVGRLAIINCLDRKCVSLQSKSSVVQA